jgi:predicted alpha/beta hydrolase family esterase
MVSGVTQERERRLPSKQKGCTMTVYVLFIQGAGSGAYDEDQHLAESLRTSLGQRFEMRYPVMPNEDDAHYAEWRQQIELELAGTPGPVVVAGHSVGASVLMKWLSERQHERPIAGAFLLACPFWGGDGWRYDGYEELELQPGSAVRLDTSMPIYLYHCRDDDVVPFDHLALWARALPQAVVRVFDKGGHQFNNDLSSVAQDILSPAS